MKFIWFVLMALVVGCASRSGQVVIAHRGASGYLPEHTLESVSLAHGWGVDYIEADLVVTKDDQLVVLHDPHLDTTTNVAKVFPKRKRADGRYYAVDFTLQEIKKLTAHERIDLKSGQRVFSGRFSLGFDQFKVPTFHEFVTFVQELNRGQNKNIGMYVEIKNPEFHEQNGKDIVALTVAELERHQLTKLGSNVIIQCFYPPSLRRLKEEYKFQIPLVLLLAENDWNESSVDYERLKREEGLQEVSQYVDGIGPFWMQLVTMDEDGKLIDTGLVQRAKKYKLLVHVYTHRSDELMGFFENDQHFFDYFYKKLGVDGIFSDFGDRALQYQGRR